MQPEPLFSIFNFVVLPVWILLIFLPRWKWTAHVINAAVVPLALAVVYLILVARAVAVGDFSADFSSLDAISRLFADPWVLLAGWIHYLVFDLFIGSWEVRDAQSLGISHLFVVPCLALTLMLGPVGLLLYFAVRAAHGHWIVAHN